MVKRNPLQNITTSGGLLTADFIQSLREETLQHDKTSPKSFSLPKIKIETQDEFNRIVFEAWERLKGRWDEISLKLKEIKFDEANQRWVLPLLQELGFSLVHASQNIQFEDELVQIYLSHRGWWEDDAPKIHIVPPKQDLDERWSDDRNKRSPHDALQLYLNLKKDGSKWGLVTNGVLFRVLREYYHTYSRGYIEFDLENIFYERNFTDFRTLFRLAHASRFQLANGIIPLEQFYEESVAAGIKIGENLRGNVKHAIELLANGLLNRESRQEMASDLELTKTFYREILKIIYRILFIMFAEQRGMLPMHESLYAEEYSLARLRERAEGRIFQDSHSDLWCGLKNTFNLVGEGDEDLNVFGYNGELFSDRELKLIPLLYCQNNILLKVIRNLTCYQKGRILQRINFLDIGVEEIGSIYESLLDFVPRVLKTAEIIDDVDCPAGRFVLDPRGAARKITGSYYTDKRLINELIETAIKPVLKEALDSAGLKDNEREKVVLDLKVCDPACGSGAFLIAANNFLGKKLAQIRTGEKFPSERDERIARRDILSNCIYGVDLNPMALELTKVSLWINAAVKDFPLNFLNHHLKSGNSLIGTTPKIIKKGIPNSAFKAIEGENKAIITKLKRINNRQQKSKSSILDKFLIISEEESIASKYEQLSSIVEKTKKDITQKRRRYLQLITDKNFRHQKLNYNTWTSVFFWPFSEENIEVPTQGIFQLLLDGRIETIAQSVIEKVNEISEDFSFFHWVLEFPEVFRSRKRGFDCILGNPPWERVKLQEKEFFESRAPEIASARSAAERKRLIKQKLKTNHILADEYHQAIYRSRKISHFLRNSNLFPNTGRGDVNTYSVFTERILSLISRSGRAGIIVPTGIATDYYTQEFFKETVENDQLISLYDFENRKKIFPEVDGRYKFSLLTLGGSSLNIQHSKYAFFLHDPIQLRDSERTFSLSKVDFSKLNPNTLTCPVFRTRRDAEITKRIYQRVPVLIERKEDKELNPWEISFLRMIDMTNDSELFRTYDQLISDNFKLESSGIFRKGMESFLPLYEGRMINIYDHRAASVGMQEKTTFRSGVSIQTTVEQYKDLDNIALPRYWIRKEEVDPRIPGWYHTEVLLGFKNVTSPTNRRTFICTFIPRTAVGNAIPLILSPLDTKLLLVLVGNLSSLIFDYVVRQKIGGINMNFYLIEQLPVFPPDFYSNTLLNTIIPKVLELTCTSNLMNSLLKKIGLKEIQSPFIWNEERRLNLTCELDAIFATLYGVTREELIYILDTFPIIKRKDKEKYREYRTKRLILGYFDKINIDLLEE